MHEAERRESWLAERRRHITSTDLPAIMGLDGAFNSKMGIFLDKLGRASNDEATPEWIEWGTRLQDSILKGYADRVGEAIDLHDPYTLIEVPDHPLISVSLDARWREKDRRCVDAKNLGFFDPKKWGPPDTDEVPAGYVVQLHAQMDATKTAVAELACLFGGHRLLIYRVERDDEIVAACREAATDFWTRHVLTDTPPPVDGSAEWTRFLSSRKQSSEKVVEADADATRWALALREAKEAKAAAEEREQEAGNHLRAVIGEHAGLRGEFGRLSYRRSKDSPVVDQDTLIAALATRLGELDPAAKQFVAAVTKKCTTTKPGNRPLRATWAREKE